jgi:bifunctional UDP-N-acetylglucosamine pyrophosphorylase/glucosamine-1-phosphate N-acetyltransferase
VTDPTPVSVFVLAAGAGTRMKSATPKTLHTICGRTLLWHVLGAVGPLATERLVVVVGDGRDEVARHLAEIAPQAQTAVQKSLRGTGNAVRVALQEVPDLGGDVLVVPGDTPLLRRDDLQRMLDRHRADGAAASMLTAELPDPTGYGRVVRGPKDRVVGIVEHRDADEKTREIKEIATGFYAFDVAELRRALELLDPHDEQGEEYLTDVIGLFAAGGKEVVALPAADWRTTLGVNDRAQLADAERILRDRIVGDCMRNGVTMLDPATVWLDLDVVLAADAVVHPNTQLYGRTVIRSRAQVGPNCTLTDTVVDEGATVTNSVCIEAEIGPDAKVGPFAYLRPGTVLRRGAKVGSFVETKSAEVGEDARVPHLSYVGDAVIGERTNIGAATVFVNYDGEHKHRTVVGADARVGSDTMLVAPVTVGDGAYTAAGSVITQDVPPGALGVARGRQRNVGGWVERARPGSAAARAAKRARGGGSAAQEETGPDTGDSDAGEVAEAEP